IVGRDEETAAIGLDPEQREQLGGNILLIQLLHAPSVVERGLAGGKRGDAVEDVLLRLPIAIGQAPTAANQAWNSISCATRKSTAGARAPNCRRMVATWPR